MAKVTSKLQLTVPKAVADRYGIRPGDELEWVPAGEAIRVVIVKNKSKLDRQLNTRQRLELFDQATERQRRRQRDLLKGKASARTSGDRGWNREELYTRGFPG